MVTRSNVAKGAMPFKGTLILIRLLKGFIRPLKSLIMPFKGLIRPWESNWEPGFLGVPLREYKGI